MNYDNLSDEQRIELLQTEQDDRQRAFIIRSFSSDELKLQYIHLVIEDENKSSVTYDKLKLKCLDEIEDDDEYQEKIERSQLSIKKCEDF